MSTDNIDISHYVRLVWHNKWKIAAFVALMAGLTALLLKPIPSVYQATATLLVEVNNNSNLLGFQGGSSPVMISPREYKNTQMQIIRSRVLKERVIDRLELTTHPLYDFRQHEQKESLFSFLKGDSEPEEMSDQDVEYAIRAIILQDLNQNLQVGSEFGTQLVGLQFQSQSPELAAQVVNAMTDVYIESYLEANLDTTKRATSWLSERLGELRENLLVSEERLQNYKEEEELVDVQGVRTLDSTQLEQLTGDLVTAQQERTAAQTIYEQVRSRQGSVEGLLDIPDIINNAVIQTLLEGKTEADRNVNQLRGRYGPRHPQMLAAIEQQDEANAELNARVASVARSIEADYEAALRSERSIQRQISSTRSRLQNVSRKEVRLRELERDVETNRQLYDLFLSRGKETDEQSRLEEPPARIIDPAVIPSIPVGPEKVKFLALAVIGSLGLSIGLLIFLDLIDTSIRTGEDVENRLKVPMLGFVPMLKNKKSKAALRVFGREKDDLNNQGFSEAIRTIRTSLVLSSLENPFQVILVTSSVPDEGKSTIALNLAEAMGQMEKVLLLDADLRRPSIAKAVGVPTSTVGLANVLQGSSKITDAITKVGDSEIDLISTGVPPQNPLELLGSKKFKEVLQELRNHYDRIIIDAAPVHVVSDAQVLSSQVDSLVYVVKSNVTTSSIASRGLKLLQKVGAPLTGVILNYVDTKKSTQYDTLYGVYSKNYGYGQKTEKA